MFDDAAEIVRRQPVGKRPKTEAMNEIINDGGRNLEGRAAWSAAVDEYLPEYRRRLSQLAPKGKNN